MCAVKYILNGQVTDRVTGPSVPCMGIKTMKIDAKPRRNERGYDLEKLWVGTSEGKDTRTIQYPLTSR
jgi:hypothetical protein